MRIILSETMKRYRVRGEVIEETEDPKAKPSGENRSPLLEMNTKMGALIDRKHYWDALEVFKDLRRKKIQRNITSYNLALEAYAGLANAFGIKSILAVLKRKESFHTWTSTFEIALPGYLKCNRNDLVLDLFNQVLPKLVKKSILIHNCMLEAHLRKGNLAQIHDWFKKMEESGPQPNAKTYSILIQSYIAKGDTSAMKKIFGQYPKVLQGKPDRDLYKAVIKAYLGANKREEAFKLVSSMDCTTEEAIQWIIKTELEKNEEKGLEIFDYVEQKYPMHQRYVNAVMNHFASNKNMDKMEEYKEYYNTYNLEVTLETYNIEMKGYNRANNFAKVLEIHEEVKKKNFLGSQRRVVYYTELVDAIGFSREISQLVRIFDETQTLGVEVDTNFWTSVIEASMRNSRLDYALQAFEIMKQQNIKLTNKCCKTFASQALRTTFVRFGLPKDMKEQILQFSKNCTMDDTEISPTKELAFGKLLKKLRK
jgi:pentatricopeptide repeat protein